MMGAGDEEGGEGETGRGGGYAEEGVGPTGERTTGVGTAEAGVDAGTERTVGSAGMETASSLCDRGNSSVSE